MLDLIFVDTDIAYLHALLNGMDMKCFNTCLFIICIVYKPLLSMYPL